MTKILSMKLSIILVSLVLVLSIIALMLLNGSTAWFAENKNVDAGGMAVMVNSDGIVDRVDFYPISSISFSGSNNIYTFSSTPIEDPANREIGAFSPIVAERQILVKITLKEGVAAASVRAVAESQDYIANTNEISKEGNPLSSVVEFYAISDIVEENNSYVISSEDIVNVPSRFVTISEQNGETVCEFTSEISIYATAQGDTDNTIFVLVDYYEDAVDRVIDCVNRLIAQGASDAVMGENIGFVCDFKLHVS